MQPTNPPRSARPHRPVSAVLPCFLATLVLTLAIPVPAPAATDRNVGMRLLEAQLPPGSSVARADCELMVRVVRRAALANHQQAGAILTAAILEVPQRPGDRSRVRWSCACVRRILVTAVRAAPDHTSELLEVAASLAPECADELSKAVSNLDDKNVVDDPKDRGGRDGASNRDPNATSSNLSDRDYRGLDVAGNGSDSGFGGINVPGSASATDGGSGFTGGFGSGFGPGFPGSPGFAGSSPGGGFALPIPVAPPVTAAANN